jgi:cystatin-related protein
LASAANLKFIPLSYLFIALHLPQKFLVSFFFVGFSHHMASSEILSAYQSPAKKQRCEGAPQPESPLEETEDPRSKIEFYTYDEDVEDDSDGMHEITQEELDEGLRKKNESDGFNVMHFPRSFACGQICPILNMERDGQDLKSHSQLALQQYNEQKKTNLEFVKVVKANWEGVAGIKYYITFDVKVPDAVDGRTMEFQASVWDGISKTTINFCRPKPNRGV